MKSIYLPIFLAFFGMLFIGCRENSSNNSSSNNNTTNNTNNTNNSNNTNNINNIVCGDGVVGTGEVCDGTNLDSHSCMTVGMGFTGGTLACDVGCAAWDTSQCITSTDSTATPPAEILQQGSGGGYLLRGVVLTPTGILSPGEVLVINDTITCVDTDCTSETGADTATWVNTNGIISPGLIDAHNHMSYDFLPEWVPDPPTLFENRYQWADDPAYEAFILPYSKHRSSNSHFCPASKWGEFRALVHGTTTMEGQPSASGSCINGWVRNTNRYHGLGYDHMRGTISSPREITTDDASNLVLSFEASVEPTTRYHVHMAEGITSDHITEEFDSFAGRDPRANRHAGTDLLAWGTAILIHAIPLTPEQITEVFDTNSKIVWSPSSNIVLYGVTAPIQQFIQAGITVGIGPDWTLSGEDHMLGELRYARNYGISENIPELTNQKLWEMATADNADVVGLRDYIGVLEPGYKADIVVIGRAGNDPYGAVIDARPEDVRLVLIGGEGYYGDTSLQTSFARNATCETLDACGTSKFICVADPASSVTMASDSMADIHTELYNILEGIGYPADEQYGRGDELLELIQCQ